MKIRISPVGFAHRSVELGKLAAHFAKVADPHVFQNSDQGLAIRKESVGIDVYEPWVNRRNTAE